LQCATTISARSCRTPARPQRTTASAYQMQGPGPASPAPASVRTVAGLAAGASVTPASARTHRAAARPRPQGTSRTPAAMIMAKRHAWVARQIRNPRFALIDHRGWPWSREYSTWSDTNPMITAAPERWGGWSAACLVKDIQLLDQVA